MGCAVLLSSSSTVHDRAACKRHNAALRSLWWCFEFPFKHPMDSPQQLELALWEVEQTVLSKHISLWTPLSTESWGAEIGCNHVDRWLTFYCSAKPNLQGWWWIENVWNDAIPQILWLSRGAALQCSRCQSTGLSNVYVTCTCGHAWHAQTSGNAKKKHRRCAVQTGNLNCTTTQHMYEVKKQYNACIILSRACKHNPHSSIMPYWSDRVSRKLAENTNTAWGGSLKLDTSLLSMVFSSSGNHLVAHAYQVLSPSLSLYSAFFRHCCLLQCLSNGSITEIAG